MCQLRISLVTVRVILEGGGITVTVEANVARWKEMVSKFVDPTFRKTLSLGKPPLPSVDKKHTSKKKKGKKERKKEEKKKEDTARER